MNRRTFLRRAAVVPVAGGGLLIGVRPPTPVVSSKTGVVLNVNLTDVVPLDGKWRTVSVTTRARQVPQNTGGAAWMYLDSVQAMVSR